MTVASATPGDEKARWGRRPCRQARFQAGFAAEDKPARRQARRQEWQPGVAAPPRRLNSFCLFSEEHRLESLCYIAGFAADAKALCPSKGIQKLTCITPHVGFEKTRKIAEVDRMSYGLCFARWSSNAYSVSLRAFKATSRTKSQISTCSVFGFGESVLCRWTISR